MAEEKGMVDKSSSKCLYILCEVVFWFAVVNFLAFFLESQILHGDALNGFIENSHYYVNSHGVFTEVSERVWKISRLHAISVFITHPLGIISIGYARAIDKELGGISNATDLRKR